jgi:hypothetical protein
LLFRILLDWIEVAFFFESNAVRAAALCIIGGDKASDFPSTTVA